MKETIGPPISWKRRDLVNSNFPFNICYILYNRIGHWSGSLQMKIMVPMTAVVIWGQEAAPEKTEGEGRRGRIEEEGAGGGGGQAIWRSCWNCCGPLLPWCQARGGLILTSSFFQSLISETSTSQPASFSFTGGIQGSGGGSPGVCSGNGSIQSWDGSPIAWKCCARGPAGT